jgi:hypothetical protein
MNSLYKRIITLGMISVTAVLAWIYCMVAFPKQLVYLAIISLVVVVSLYALLNALTGLNIEKEKKTQAYLRQTANEIVNRIQENDNSEETYRLFRATYVQIRKSNKTISTIAEEVEHGHEQDIVAAKAQHDEVCMLMADYINKATKVIVKYNENNNNRLIETVDTLSAQVAELKLAIGGDENATGEDYTEILTGIMNKLDNIKVNVAQSTVDDVTVKEQLEDAVETLASQEPQDTADDFDEEDESIILAQQAIQALRGNNVAETAVEPEPETVAEPTPEPEPESEAVAESEPTPAVSDDPNKQLSADEIAALFAASKEERRAESDDDFKVEDHPEAMDQNLINALLGLEDANASEPTPAPEPEPVPEPTSAPEPVAVTPVSDDPNKQLSADEIAALFASANAAPTPAPEPEPEPEPTSAPVLSDDPNKQLSADEIAALFASMGS